MEDDKDKKDKQEKNALDMGKEKDQDKAKDLFGRKKKGAKAKITKAILKVVVPILLKVLLPVILASILIAGFWKIIKGDQQSSNSNAYSSATSAGSTAAGENGEATTYANPTISIVAPGEEGNTLNNNRYAVVFDITEEEENEVREFLRSNNINDLTDENIKFITALVKHGYKLKDYSNPDQLKALFLFFKADIASQSLDLRPESEMFINGEYNPPNFDEEGIPGIITVKKYRMSTNDNDISEQVLEFIPKADFDTLLNEGNTIDINDFTVNENGDLIIANATKVDVDIENENPSFDAGEESETYSIYSNTVQFKQLISKSALPFNLMQTLMVYVEDPTFYVNIAETVRTSNIVLALKEEETVNIQKTTTEYTPRTEKYYDFSYYVTREDSDGQLEQITHGAKRPLKLLDGKNYTSLENGTPFNVIETITTTSYKQSMEIKEIKNWFMDYKIEDYSGSTNPTVTDGPTDIHIEEEEYNGITNYKTEEGFSTTTLNSGYSDSIIDSFKGGILENIPEPYNWTLNGDIYHRTQNIETAKNVKTDTTTTTITNGETAQEFRTQDSEGSFLYYYDQSESAKATFDCVNPIIFEDLEKDETTIDQVNILKYLLYLYTGKEEYNVEVNWQSMVGELGFSMFGNVMRLQEYIYQLEHGNGQIPGSNEYGGKYYKMYDDTTGNPTIGVGTQWKSKYDFFSNVSGYVIQDGQETLVSDVAEYVKNKLDGNHYYNYKQDGGLTIDQRNIYIQKELVDAAWEDSISKWTNKIDRMLPNIPLSTQQRYALIAMCFARGGNAFDWAKLRNIYATSELNSPEQLRRIWDEWWYDQGLHRNSEGKVKSPSGVVKGQDAIYETYVKGTFDFNKPWPVPGAGDNGSGSGVMGRHYFVFYTASQKSEFLNANLNIVRNSSNESEIFEYVETNFAIGGVLGTAQELWLRVCARGSACTYGAGDWTNITGTGNIRQIDCSSYVSGVLYHYGYNIGCCDTGWFANTSVENIEKFGTIVASGSGTGNVTTNIQGGLQPGDIVVRRRENNQAGHVCIVVKMEDNKIYAYDCGMQKYWLNNPNGANLVNVTSFVTTGTTTSHTYTGPWRVIRPK